MDAATVWGMLEQHFGVSILELPQGKIVRESIYVSEGWEPPEWRAKWRAAP
jgi:hypothetical protein